MEYPFLLLWCIIGKYDNIEYLPETGDFQIESNKKVGIIGKDGKTKVQPYYDAIDLMDSASGLYLVQKDKKYGVIDIRGNTKIYIENDGFRNMKFHFMFRK